MPLMSLRVAGDGEERVAERRRDSPQHVALAGEDLGEECVQHAGDAHRQVVGAGRRGRPEDALLELEQQHRGNDEQAQHHVHVGGLADLEPGRLEGREQTPAGVAAVVVGGPVVVREQELVGRHGDGQVAAGLEAAAHLGQHRDIVGRVFDDVEHAGHVGAAGGDGDRVAAADEGAVEALGATVLDGPLVHFDTEDPTVGGQLAHDAARAAADIQDGQIPGCGAGVPGEHVLEQRGVELASAQEPPVTVLQGGEDLVGLAIHASAPLGDGNHLVVEIEVEGRVTEQLERGGQRGEHRMDAAHAFLQEMHRDVLAAVLGTVLAQRGTGNSVADQCLARPGL